MTDHTSNSRDTALQELEAALLSHRRAQNGAPAPQAAPAPQPRRKFRFPRLGSLAGLKRWWPFNRRHPVMRKLAIGTAVVLALFLVAGGALWWRLASGPIALDLATPWLTAAIEENFGSRYRIQVGGTQLERDAQGRTAIRLRDIVLRDASGKLVAVAPKAEVGISGSSVLIARPRAQSFRLVDANMVIRIEPDGNINVFAGGELPFASFAPMGGAAAPGPSAFSLQSVAERSMLTNVAGVLAWIDGVGSGGSSGGVAAAGFDGHNLTEVGISNGSLTIDDRRNGQEWKFSQISLKLIRPKEGGTILSVGSEREERPWLLHAALTPGQQQGYRQLHLEARKVLMDDLLALRMVEGGLRSDTQISASVKAEFAADGVPQVVAGTVVAEGGSISRNGSPEGRVDIGGVEVGLDWDIARGTLRVPFKIMSGKTRITLRSEFAAPPQAGGNWMFAFGGGWIVLDPLTADDEGLVLKRVIVRGTIDPTRQRIALEQADLGTRELGSKETRDVSVAASGTLDYAGEGRLAVGLAGNQMTVSALKRLWPVFIAPKVRDWVVDHIATGTVERFEVATNAPLAALQPGGPPLPEESLSVAIVTSATTLQPVAGLPTIRDADLNARITGRSATVTLGKGTIDVSPGRRLTISNGTFDVPDTHPNAPPARVRFRVEGPVPAAAEMLALDRLREFSGAPFDPATTRGTMVAQANLSMPLRPDLPRGATTYNINVDLSNFNAERMLFGQRVEAQALRVTATNQRYEIKGEVKVGGTPAQIEYRKATGDADAELRLFATLDEAARTRLGLDVGSSVVGPMPVKLAGRVGASEKDSRFTVEADLTPARVDNLLPGWVKPPGKLARAAFTLVKDKNTTRFDDLLIDGQGILVKGTVELDGNGELQSVNFPVFATSDGDKTTLRAERGPDGALRVAMRGDIYDGRNFVKSALSGPGNGKTKPRYSDLDLDIRIGVVAGHHGEALRGLDLRLSRRAGRVRTFNLNAKIARDTPLLGEMRTRIANGRQVLYIETNDAGALFRFTDLYGRILGGKMWIGMDPPTQDQAPQEGILSVRDFAIRGEGTLDRVVPNAPANNVPVRNQVEFSQARADFTRHPGRMVIRDGVVRGPVIGATMEGQIDYSRDAVNVRGTLVPLYGINNMFGQIPIVGLFLGGGSNEGIFGITYEVTGSTSDPRPIVNPISAIAPGLLRKFFEFRDPNAERTFTDHPIR